MFILHIPTLLLVLLLGFALLTLQLWVAQRGALQQGELRALSLAAWSLLVGFLLLGARVAMPLWLSALLGSAMIFVGVAALSAAVYAYVLNRALPRSYWLLIGAALAVTLLVLREAQALRTQAISLALVALLVPASWVALRHGWQAERSFRLVGLSLLVALAGLGWRGVDAGLRPGQYDDLMAGGAANGWTLMFGFMSLLAAGFGFVLACFERMARQMQQLASIDGLTGCANHNTTVALLAHAMERGRREGQPVAFALFDLDHFKQINDRHGHALGDTVLRQFAACVRERLRGSDVFGRLGGEEFGLVLPATDVAGASAVAEQLRVGVAALSFTGDAGQPVQITASVGLAVAQPTDGYNVEQLMQLADKALYQAKTRGRNRVVLADAWMLNSTMSSLLE